MSARASTTRYASRSPVWRSAVASSTALFAVAAFAAAACQSEGPISPPPNDVSFSGTGATGSAGRGGSGGTTTGSGGTGTSSGGAPATGGSGGSVSTGGTVSTGGSVSTGGTVSTGGSVSTGGMSTGGTGGTVASGGSGATSGSGGMGPKPCVDVEPPPDPDWPGATCTNWANETSECSAAWFATYCDASCGRCTPTGGSGGSGGMGSGGSAGSGSGGSAGGTQAVDCSKENLPNVSGGNGYATRYWDCCQTHCSQFDGHRCGQDGTSGTGDTNSSCNGGGSFACYDQSPKKVSDCLSYGYIAKANPNCGGCYRIQFTGEGQYNANDPGSKLIKGKQMIVKVSNTGGDVASNQFDMMIPGGGVGQFNACSRQWGTSDLGAQYGGFLTNCSGDLNAKKECVRTNCQKIPAGPARDGCLWFVDWFNVADNPKFTSESTNCPF